MPRRLRQVIADAQVKIDAGGATIDVFRGIGIELAAILSEWQAQGFVQFEFTVKPFGFRLHLPESTAKEPPHG